MSYRSIVKFGVLLSLVNGLLFAAGQTETQWKWSELASVVQGHKVALVLPQGAEIQGKILGVEADGLRMHVSKTSDRKVVAKGKQLIPRQSVSVLRLTEYHKLGRIACTLGAVAAASLIIAAQDIQVYEGPAVIAVPAAAAMGVAGVGVAGYYVGKRLDKRVVYIRVAPEN